MNFLSFEVGPSMMSPETHQDIKQMFAENFTEQSHRGEAFIKTTTSAIKKIREYFCLPQDYEILYTGSATEGMDLIFKNIGERQKTYHFTKGNFSNRFLKCAELLGHDIHEQSVEWGEENDYSEATLKEIQNINPHLITLCHNETSTGIMTQESEIQKIRENFPNSLLAIDITSSVGAIKHNFSTADAWIFSVQKILGLPSGLGLMFVSPRLMQKASEQKNIGFLSIPERLKSMPNTTFTPNIINIYLLEKILTRWLNQGGITITEKQTQEKYEKFREKILSHAELNFFGNHHNTSRTTFCIETNEANLAKIFARAKKQNITLGKGYGKLQNTTFRVANFPAVSLSHLQQLVTLF